MTGLPYSICMGIHMLFRDAQSQTEANATLLMPFFALMLSFLVPTTENGAWAVNVPSAGLKIWRHFWRNFAHVNTYAVNVISDFTIDPTILTTAWAGEVEVGGRAGDNTASQSIN
ncbi:hypothetical protein FRB91_008105 [Serendipita sp. 411]|nr:hypothetical protein FRB91_008105 [Serendipita sp. 411]